MKATSQRISFQSRNSRRRRIPLNTAHITVLIIFVVSVILTLPHWFEYKIVQVNTTLVVERSAFRNNCRGFYHCKTYSARNNGWYVVG